MDRDNPAFGYVVAIVATVAMVALRWVLTPWLGDNLPFITLFGAIAAAVWFGGYRPAIAAAIVGYIGVNYVFIAPHGAFAIVTDEDRIGLVLYLLTSVIIIGLGERMRAAQRWAKERLELLRVTFASIGDAVVTTDPDGRVTSLNSVAESLTGWTDAEATGRPLEDVFRIINEDTRKTVESPARRALAEGRIVDLANHTLLIAKDGTERAIDDSASPIRGAGGRLLGVVLVFRDVSRRRQADEEQQRAAQSLRESEERLRIALDSGRMGTWEWRPRANTVVWSTGLEILHGLKPGTFAGTFEAYQSDIHPEDRERVIGAISKSIQDQHDHHIEYRIVWPDGSVHWIEGRGKLFVDATGAPERLVGVCMDIDERKRNELALKDADRRKDEFLAALAHELRNPVAAVTIAAEILRTESADDDRAGVARDVIVRQVGQLQKLIDDLLDIARSIHGKLKIEPRLLDLRQVAQDVVKICQMRYADQPARFEVMGESAAANCDPARLQQIIENLLDNAVKFGARRIVVRIDSEPEWASISVDDDGQGIPAELLPRLL